MTEDRLRRWRLVLGGEDADGTDTPLEGYDGELDATLSALYDSHRTGDLRPGSPYVARWLGDVRRYFPGPVVAVLQRDAIERLDLAELLLDPDLLAQVEPDVHLVTTLMALAEVLPDETRATARTVVAGVVEALSARLRTPLVQAVRGVVDRSARRRPRGGDVDWDRTIRANLKHWQPDRKLLIPERVVGYGRKAVALQDVVLCVDQSGSMARSVVYAGIFGAALASLRSVSTRMAVFATEVVELTFELRDPVDLLFGVQVGGGTDIGRALGWCEQVVERPERTLLVLITDLHEGGDPAVMLTRAARLVQAGVNLVVLLALDDEGAPAWHAGHARALAALGCPVFACTPDQFPGLMATALERRDVALWAAREGIAVVRPPESR